jgi:hypothetical protein
MDEHRAGIVEALVGKTISAAQVGRIEGEQDGDHSRQTWDELYIEFTDGTFLRIESRAIHDPVTQLDLYTGPVDDD